MKCKKVKKQLILYVGGDLPLRKTRAVELHLEHCPSCMAELKELKRMKKGVQAIAQSDIPEALHPEFPEKVARMIVDMQESSRPTRKKSVFWLMPKPVRVASLCAIAILLVASAYLIFLSPEGMTSSRLIKEIASDSRMGSSELVWDPEHIFFKAFDGPYRLDHWDAPRESGVYAVLHKATSGEGHTTYIIDYCGQGRNLSSYRGYPWIQHRIKRLVAHTGSAENVYVAVFLMPNSSRQERQEIEEALVRTFNPYFNRGV